eukprot:jgi/Chlat1/869/Chrsp107S01343
MVNGRSVGVVVAAIAAWLSLAANGRCLFVDREAPAQGHNPAPALTAAAQVLLDGLAELTTHGYTPSQRPASVNTCM